MTVLSSPPSPTAPSLPAIRPASSHPALALLRIALVITFVTPPVLADDSHALLGMENPTSAESPSFHHPPTLPGRRNVNRARTQRGGGGSSRSGPQCTLTIFCWLAGGWPARRGCSLGGAGGLLAPWWLVTARCTPQDAPPPPPMAFRRPYTPPPQLPDRRHHIALDDSNPPPPPPNREMECGIPKILPRGLYPTESEYADDENEAFEGGIGGGMLGESVEGGADQNGFMEEGEDGYGIGEVMEGRRRGGEGGIPSNVISKRIVGGSEARFGEFPWQAHIRIAGYQCGGVLVGKAHVATAAHCVHRARLRDITVFLGEYDTQNTGLYSEPLPGEARRVIKKVIHPEFQYRVTQPDRFDLALLRLSRPVSFRANIIPICLPSVGQDINFKGRLGVVAGWGKTDTSYGKTGTNILHKATVPILRDDECLRWHRSKNIRLQLYSEMFCAGHRDGHSDACLGDSGGPLVVLVGGRWTLAGITSAGFGCAVDHQPGIYHKVAVTAEWIAEQVS